MMNQPFTAVDARTGQVQYAGTAHNPLAFAAAGVRILLGVAHQGGWVDAQGVHYSQPPSHSPHHVFDWTSKTWSDPRSLQDLKAAKRAEINAARLAANQTSFAYLGQQIAADALSRGDIETTNGVILLTGTMPPNWVGGWKTIANTYVPIPDVATWGQFYLAMNSQGALNFAHAQALKAQLAAAQTAQEIENIAWGVLPSLA